MGGYTEKEIHALDQSTCPSCREGTLWLQKFKDNESRMARTFILCGGWPRCRFHAFAPARFDD